MDHLRSFLRDKNPKDPVNYGHNWNILVEKGYESGGAGYVLSNEAFKRIGSALNANYSYCRKLNFEDVDVAHCLRTLQVYPGNTTDEEHKQRFHAFNITDQMKRKVFYF